jgi:acid stress chaperone HdeB
MFSFEKKGGGEWCAAKASSRRTPPVTCTPIKGWIAGRKVAKLQRSVQLDDCTFEDAMKARNSVAVLVFALCLPAAGHAQVTVDVAKLTCKQFLLDAVAPTKSVTMWLSGYYHGKHGGTVVDFAAMTREADKVEDYCRMHLDVTVMDAVEAALDLK